jgi:plastocyanin
VTRIRIAAPVLAAATLLAGCGGDDEASEPRQVSLTVSKSGSTYDLTAPASIEAGLVEISLRVDAPASEQHDAQLLRVVGDHSVEEAIAVVTEEGAPIPSWIFAAGGAGSTPGGETATVTQVLEPGKYYVVDLGEGQGDDVPSFAEQGATATIEVTGDADAELPETDATVTAEDFSFSTEGLEAGVNRVRFDNTGKEIHHIVAVPYAEGATLAQVKEFATTNAPPSGPPPVDFERALATSAIEGGTSQITDLDLDAGKYAFLCFITNRAGGPPHVAYGMVAEVVVE